MTSVGVPGSLDGPPIEPKVTGEVVVTFLDNGKSPTVSWPRRVQGRRPREVIREAIESLERVLSDDMLEKLEGDPPREPPFSERSGEG